MRRALGWRDPWPWDGAGRPGRKCTNKCAFPAAVCRPSSRAERARPCRLAGRWPRPRERARDRMCAGAHLRRPVEDGRLAGAAAGGSSKMRLCSRAGERASKGELRSADAHKRPLGQWARESESRSGTQARAHTSAAECLWLRLGQRVCLCTSAWRAASAMPLAAAGAPAPPSSLSRHQQARLHSVCVARAEQRSRTRTGRGLLRPGARLPAGLFSS